MILISKLTLSVFFWSLQFNPHLSKGNIFSPFLKKIRGKNRQKGEKEEEDKQGCMLNIEFIPHFGKL
jgi:hypothetical protein